MFVDNTGPDNVLVAKWFQNLQEPVKLMFIYAHIRHKTSVSSESKRYIRLYQ